MLAVLFSFIISFESYSDSLDYLIENPININYATVYELEEIPFLSMDEIYLVEKLRPFRNFDDFKRRMRLDPVTADLLRPYIYFSKIPVRKLKISTYLRKKQDVLNKDSYIFMYGRSYRALIRRKNDVNFYRVRFKIRRIYIEMGNLKLDPLTLSFKPSLRFDESALLSTYFDIYGVKFFYRKNKIFASSPSFKRVNLWVYSGIYRYAGLNYLRFLNSARLGIELSIMRNAFMVKSVIYKRINRFKFRLKGGYSSSNFLHPMTLDTINSFLSAVVGFPIGPIYVKIRQSTVFTKLKPRSSSILSLYFSEKVSLMFRTSIYEDYRWNSINANYSFMDGDTLKFFEKTVSPGNSYATGIEFDFLCISTGFIVISPDVNDYISVKESGIRYPDYPGSSVPDSRFYLLFRKDFGNLRAGLKFAISRNSGSEFSGGLSFQWQ